MMTTIKIEKLPVRKNQARTKDFGAFVKAVRDLKVGESFVHLVQSHHRLAITIMQHLFDRQYTMRKEDAKSHRIGRIA